MIWRVPAELEDAVREAARAVVGDAALADGPLGRAVVDRSKRYTSERERLAQPADRVADLAARAAFFTIADAIKVAIPLRELANRGALPAREPLRVVDIGAGCGALSLGAAVTLQRPLEVVAIDRDADALRLAAAALRTFSVAVTTRTGDVSTALPPADLVLIGSVLNELPAAARLPLVERALAALADDGALIIIEPALRDTSRALHELRDAVLAKQLAHVFAPCTRGIAPCPALADPDDWCHEDRLVELPPRTAQLAKTTHLRDAGLKFSYLVLRRAPSAMAGWRLVGEPRAQKGKLELTGCSDAGRVPLRLLSRHRTSGNRELERAHRGDVIVTDATSDGERVEITRDTRVERIEPAR